MLEELLVDWIEDQDYVYDSSIEGLEEELEED